MAARRDLGAIIEGISDEVAGESLGKSKIGASGARKGTRASGAVGHLESGRHAKRDQVQCRLAVDLLGGERLSSETVRHRYYQDLSDASFHKTFKRDRAALESEGIWTIERAQGVSKTWELDGGRSLADVGALGAEDSLVAATLLRVAASDPSVPNHGSLGEAVARIGLGSCTGPAQAIHRAPEPSPVLAAVLECLRCRRPVAMTYQSLSDDTGVRRVMRVWGLFSIGATTYAVGPRAKPGAKDAVRTYNLSRATSAEVLFDEPSYEAPADFRASDWRLLPFEIGNESVEATFFVPAVAAGSFRRAARRRGNIVEVEGSSLVWNICVRDVPACARWAVAEGIYPLGPSRITDAWEDLLEEALS